MIIITLVLGIASIFAAGALAQSFGTTGNRSDFYTSIIGFVSGIFILISMIGMIVE